MRTLRLSNNRWIGICSILLGCSAVFGGPVEQEANRAAVMQDVQLRAMLDELTRSKTLQLNVLDKPYFVSYSSDDGVGFDVSASLGGILYSNRFHLRHPRVEVRVGSYKFDNTNSIYSGFGQQGLLPIDDDYQAIRNDLWLYTDGLYKAAVEQIAAKRNALREIVNPEDTPDFAPATPAHILLPISKLKVDQQSWNAQVRQLSAGFVDHPDIVASSVRLMAIDSTYRIVNTEGTVGRFPQEITNLEIRAAALTPDGTEVWNHRNFTALRPSELPPAAELAKAVQAIATETDALNKAPQAEEYSGPILFQREAAAQLVAELLTDALRIQRRPLAPKGANSVPMIESVWSSKLGARVTPEWLSIVDDPLQTHYKNAPLAGYYPADDEGVPARSTTLVDKGTLKAFLLSREPVRNLDASNGHGRLPGPFGTEAAVIGNLFVNANQTTPEDQMKTKLLERVKTAGLPFGILIRRLDFPSTANAEILQGLGRQLQKNGYSRTVSDPILAYRVYPDGREELVRGLRFKEFSAKDLRDLTAASDQPYVLNYVNNGSAFAFADMQGDITTSSIICPSLLFDSVELDRAQQEASKAPVVPPPALVSR